MGAYNRNNYREKKEMMPLKDENESYLYQTICRMCKKNLIMMMTKLIKKFVICTITRENIEAMRIVSVI